MVCWVYSLQFPWLTLYSGQGTLCLKYRNCFPTDLQIQFTNMCISTSFVYKICSSWGKYWQAHDVNITSPQRRCNVMTLHRRWGDVIFTSCARWDNSCILNSRCINFCITYHKNDFFFLQILFYTLLTISNDINKVFNIMSSTLITWRDSILKEIFLSRNYKLLILQKLLQIVSVK